MTRSSHSNSPFLPKHPSGIDVVDDTWGGFYRGGCYLVYGQALSGRGLLALMVARKGTVDKEKTLFVSSDRQKDLFIQAASIGFDLRSACDAGSVRLIRVPTLAEIRYENDDNVAAALTDLVEIIIRHRPNRVILNDFIPFIAFRSFQRFQIEFIRLLEKIDGLDSTIVLVMPEPVSAASRRVIEFMGLQMTGSVHIELAEDSPRSTRRRISLIPHIGHIRHRIVDYWDLEDVIQDDMVTLDAVESFESTANDSLASYEAEAEAEEKEVAAEKPAWPLSPEMPSQHELPSQPEMPLQPEVPSQPELPVQPEQVEVPSSGSPDVLDFMDKTAFRDRLESKFAIREKGDNPFLLLAMKMDRKGEKAIRPFDFDFLMDLVQEALRPVDDLYIDAQNERLIVVLSDCRPEDAQHFFARLKRSLKEETPLQADHLLHNVSAIVVPDGRPFQTVTEFIQYALNES